jgi:hypothetical protein
MLLLQVPEHVYDQCCCSNESLILFCGLYYLFFRVLCRQFLVLWSVVKYPVSYYRVISKFFRLQKITSIDKFLLLMKMLLVVECVTSLAQTVVMGVMSMRSE